MIEDCLEEIGTDHTSLVVIQTVAAHSMQLSTIRLLDLRVVVHRPTQQIP